MLCVVCCVFLSLCALSPFLSLFFACVFFIYFLFFQHKLLHQHNTTHTHTHTHTHTGVFWPYFEHAESQVVAANKRVLSDVFEARGARVKDIVIADMSVIARAHGLTILSELANTMDKYYSEVC